jgi:hypothetical protein
VTHIEPPMLVKATQETGFRSPVDAHHFILGNPSSPGVRAGVNQAHGRAPRVLQCLLPSSSPSGLPPPPSRFPRLPMLSSLAVATTPSSTRPSAPPAPLSSRSLPRSNHRQRIPVKPSQRLIHRSIDSFFDAIHRSV